MSHARLALPPNRGGYPCGLAPEKSSLRIPTRAEQPSSERVAESRRLCAVCTGCSLVAGEMRLIPVPGNPIDPSKGYYRFLFVAAPSFDGVA